MKWIFRIMFSSRKSTLSFALFSPSPVDLCCNAIQLSALEEKPIFRRHHDPTKWNPGELIRVTNPARVMWRPAGAAGAQRGAAQGARSALGLYSRARP